MLYVWRCMCQIIADLQAAHASVRTIGSHFFRWTHLIFARVQTAVVVLSTFKHGNGTSSEQNGGL